MSLVDDRLVSSSASFGSVQSVGQVVRMSLVQGCSSCKYDCTSDCKSDCKSDEGDCGHGDCDCDGD